MFDPYTYFEETALPPSGIDRISIEIDEHLIADKTAFHCRGNNNQASCLRKKNHNGYGLAYLFELQAEAINPCYNILEQIIYHLTGLTIRGVLKNYNHYPSDLINRFYHNYLNKGFYLTCLEFYFDFKAHDMLFSSMADNPLYETTRYSSDYPGERKSILKAYSRTERLKGKSHQPLTSINSMTYTNRIEFSLKNRNCRYMALENLNGEYDQVLSRFMPFLASRWREHGDYVAQVPNLNNLQYADDFHQIVELSKDRHIPRAQLMPTPPRLNFHRHYKKNETDNTWGVGFLWAITGMVYESFINCIEYR
jgi:hypothetical protein